MLGEGYKIRVITLADDDHTALARRIQQYCIQDLSHKEILDIKFTGNASNVLTALIIYNELS